MKLIDCLRYQEDPLHLVFQASDKINQLVLENSDKSYITSFTNDHYDFDIEWEREQLMGGRGFACGRIINCSHL
ncbi:MAG UNVERIFIED_CONTAM: hypothetical protein LVQ98_04370 [Rickettsiaceae bacterium]|jgi:hypothetical protein